MTAKNDRDLHPNTVEIAVALMRSSSPALDTDLETEELLTKFACGWVTQEEHDLAVLTLTRSSVSRSRLMALRRALQEASITPGNELIEKTEPLLAQTRRAVLLSVVRVCLRWREFCSAAFHGDGALSQDERRTIGLLLAQLGASLQQPGAGFAFTRSSTPGGSRLSVEIVNDELVARARVANDSSAFSLFAIEPLGTWTYLGSAVATNSDWELRLPNAPELLGLATGSTGPNNFAIASTEASDIFPSAIRLDSSSAASEPTTPTSFWLPVTEVPHVSDGVLRFGVELPLAVRDDLRDYAIAAALDFGLFRYLIGEWNVDQLAASREVTFAAPTPDIPEGKVQHLSALRLFTKKPVK